MLSKNKTVKKKTAKVIENRIEAGKISASKPGPHVFCVSFSFVVPSKKNPSCAAVWRLEMMPTSLNRSHPLPPF